MSFVHGREEYEGGVYSDYGPHLGYRARAHHLDGILGGLREKTILIAGCGYGFLVQAMMERNAFSDVWGCDASPFAVAKAQQVLPYEYARRVFRSDVFDLERDYDAIVSEDLLPCAESEEEAVAMAEAMASHARVVVHFVTPRTSNPLDDRFLWLLAHEWKRLIGPQQLLIAGGEVL